jgi:aminoglycoside phosphotransferase (APT) family kinase protein
LSDLTTLAEQIRGALAARAGELGLDATRASVEPILNWGGFVNRSFRLSDGHRSLFLKLTSDAGARRGLETWRAIATLLESRYRAPRMVGWLDLRPSAFGGPLFEWIEGRTAREADGALREEVSRVLTRLHADVDVAERLPGPLRSCAQAYLASYHDRFTEDLEFVEADPPPFVSRDRLMWLRHQVGLLEDRVRQSAAFRRPADRPVHGDLWLDNVLVDATGRWHLLDWDELAQGDPVMDWAMLFGPSRERPMAASQEVVALHASLDADQRDRLAVYARASQLDWVLDPLADWVQSGREPEHGARIRAANERIHRQALELYQSRFGGAM